MNVPEDVRNLAQQGRKIQAVKRLRELTGVDLTQAKEIVDGLESVASHAQPVLAPRVSRVESKTNWANLALAGFVLGGVFALFSAYHIFMDASTAGWQNTEGVVVRSEVRRKSGGGIMPLIRYEYEVKANKYTGNRVGYGKVYSETSAKRTARIYPKGKRVKVYYNPDDPSSAVLERGGSLGIQLFFALGAAGITLGFWARRRAAEQNWAEKRLTGKMTI